MWKLYDFFKVLQFQKKNSCHGNYMRKYGRPILVVLRFFWPKFSLKKNSIKGMAGIKNDMTLASLW